MLLRLEMIRSVLVAFALLMALLPSAGAQSIYKYVRPDGSVVYSDQAVPGARLDEELEPPPPPSPADLEAARALRNSIERAADQRTSSLDQAWAELKEWTIKLELARAQLVAGREPRAGERTGVVFQGKSRMNATYLARQKANEEAVWEAEAHIKRAQAVINATR
jgi:hypothetical protein